MIKLDFIFSKNILIRFYYLLFIFYLHVLGQNEEVFHFLRDTLPLTLDR
jgi:hypothetical protein